MTPKTCTDMNRLVARLKKLEVPSQPMVQLEKSSLSKVQLVARYKRPLKTTAYLIKMAQLAKSSTRVAE